MSHTKDMKAEAGLDRKMKGRYIYTYICIYKNIMKPTILYNQYMLIKQTKKEIQQNDCNMRNYGVFKSYKAIFNQKYCIITIF